MSYNRRRDLILSYVQGTGAATTEGRSDSWIISESLRLLYPHLSDYFSFMDFEGARIGGSAGSLVNTVKAFAGTGILNKVIALFDNDTAAAEAMRGLQNLHMPNNIIVQRLPDLHALEAYPTIGPSGLSTVNVNGMAASIELYVGFDLLLDDSEEKIPVQWTGYNTTLCKYQGEILFKDRIHKNFGRRLKACRSDPSLIQMTDWNGMNAILSVLLTAFHEKDGTEILASIKKYYASY